MKEKLIFISSASRTIGSISNFQTILPNDLFEWSDEIEHGELTLVNFTAKQSYYNISYLRNSQFRYSDDEITEHTITIPDGNYNVKELATILTTLINEKATSIVWNITIDLNTLKYKFTYTGTPVGPILFRPILSSFTILGFNGIFKSITTPTTYSDKIVSIGNEPALYLHCSYVGAQNKFVEHQAHNHPTNLDQIFAKINIVGTSFFGTILYDQGNYEYKTKIPNSASTLVEFSIRDNEGNIIELNEEYNMILNLKIKKTKEFTTEHLGQLISTQMLLK